MTDSQQDDRVKNLQDRIRALRGNDAPASEHSAAHSAEHYNAVQVGWRMITELVVGVLLGFGIGYGLDSLLGTTPWLMIPLTLLGFAAGIRTMIRSAAEIQKKHQAGNADEDSSDGA